MVKSWEATILSRNDKGKIEKFVSHETSFLNGVRAITTYKPKRNYVVFDYQILVLDKLV